MIKEDDLNEIVEVNIPKDLYKKFKLVCLFKDLSVSASVECLMAKEVSYHEKTYAGGGVIGNFK